jgi:hypothetical protein
MIARDHHRPDAGRLAELHGSASLWARRIDHADEPHENHVPLEIGKLSPVGGSF